MRTVLLLSAALSSVFVVICLVNPHSGDLPQNDPWSKIPMPKTSYFAGFGLEAPTDEAMWTRARNNAISGEQILLKQVMDVIKTPGSLLQADLRSFNPIPSSVDVHLSMSTRFRPIVHFHEKRAPIVSMGGTKAVNKELFAVTQVLKHIKDHRDFNGSLPSQGIIAMGRIDVNWGWLSTYFLNRTNTWNIWYGQLNPKYDILPNGQLEQVLPFLNLKKVIMVAINQHTNISHPKVISIPLGIAYNTARAIINEAKIVLASDEKKTDVMLSLNSNWGHRPSIVECVRQKMGDDFHEVKINMAVIIYAKRLISSATVLCVPGMGYDTYRVFETLLAGGMPVFERAVGLDRSYHRLPVLLLDDFAQLTPQLLRQAYIEALYHAEKGEWDYRRLSQDWWEKLLLDTSASKDINVLMERHPMPVYPGGIPFSRPLVPFTCNGQYGGTEGCGKDYQNYDWLWHDHLQKRRREDEAKMNGI